LGKSGKNLGTQCSLKSLFMRLEAVFLEQWFTDLVRFYNKFITSLSVLVVAVVVLVVVAVVVVVVVK